MITEGWCGDAAQILPVLNAMASVNPLIQLQLVLRDANLELMDQYLTDGTSRSIPKLVVLDTATMEEQFNWGPRPAPLQELYRKMRAEGMDYASISQELHAWYAKDKNCTYSERDPEKTDRSIVAILSGKELCRFNGKSFRPGGWRMCKECENHTFNFKF